ncbi:MAG: putative Ig domain-containing protein [Candidatus Sulfotelmatobacter sp.]
MVSQEASPSFSHRRKTLASIFQHIGILALSSEMLTMAVGCGSNSLSGSAQQIQVAISPRASTLSPAAQQQFTATVQGTSNSAVTWTASAGSISNHGTFTAPVANNGTQITVTATSVTDSTLRASGLVTIQRSKLEITTSSLTGALANTLYNAGLAASGGTPPYQWTISGGSLPPGIQLQPATGVLAGTGSQLGNYSFTAKVTDAASNSATQSFTLPVSTATNGNFDGPAELPRVYLQTTLADTPAPGSTITVPAGGDLQTALNNASCGDTVELQAGATFVAHQYTFPAKTCDDQHWIIVRTSAPDASLPPEGTRMTPCYAGVSSLPGRPAFACTSPQRLLATITYPGTGDGPILFADGANHYRLLGLEITRVATDGMPVTALVARSNGGSMSQIVLDRLYIHGTPADETRRGVDLTGGTSIAVQDSYISEFHCKVGGTCVDSQAVSGGAGSLPMGPYKIDNNFLEAAGENIIFGGGAATQTPADIEIRFNHLFKPMFWLQGQPGFTAPAFIVKNHFELKNAQRVLFDSNVLEDSWGGFSQDGFSILLTPKNQSIGDVSVCPMCQVTDVTIRYATISHVAGGFLIGNGRSDSGGLALAGERYSIHDVIVDDIDAQTYAGFGTFALVGSQPQPLLQNVEINHVTAFPQHTMLYVGALNSVLIPGFIFSNNIVTAGTSPMNSTGMDGSSDCAHYDVPVKTVSLCFSGYTFSPNAVLGSPLPPSSWPSGNFFYSTASIGFVNYNNGNGGDYHLLPSSPAIGAASDGTDLGANVDAVLSAISGVQ